MSDNGALPPIPTRADLEAAGIRVVVHVPMERTVPQSSFVYFWHIAERGWPLFNMGYSRTDVNRNKAAFRLLESDYTHVMMLDLDQLHPPDVVERHARWVLQDPERLVIGGIHFRRGEPFDPCIFVPTPDGGWHSPMFWPQGLIEVGAIGHGTLLVHRSVFERIPPPWWGYDYGQAAENTWPTEDMYFCHCCRQAGIQLWCDTTTSSPHLLDSVVTEDIFRSWIAQHPEKVTVHQTPQVSGGVRLPDMITRVEA